MPDENNLKRSPTKHDQDLATKRMRVEDPVETAFRAGLFDQSTRDELSASYTASQPYRHCVIPELVNDDLLRAVQHELMTELHFTVKETDIYKVFQTGDLANLDGLPSQELARLTNVFRLRNALYSPEFRAFLSDVTGCGPLSGSKTDMSTNIYAQG